MQWDFEVNTAEHIKRGRQLAILQHIYQYAALVHSHCLGETETV